VGAAFLGYCSLCFYPTLYPYHTIPAIPRPRPNLTFASYSPSHASTGQSQSLAFSSLTRPWRIFSFLSHFETDQQLLNSFKGTSCHDTCMHACICISSSYCLSIHYNTMQYLNLNPNLILPRTPMLALANLESCSGETWSPIFFHPIPTLSRD
jgi:hypothetical protein